MSKHTIVLRRHEGLEGFQSNQSLEADASNAMSTMRGVSNPEIISASEDRVTISYDWVGKEKLWDAGDHLRQYGVSRDDLQQESS